LSRVAGGRQSSPYKYKRSTRLGLARHIHIHMYVYIYIHTHAHTHMSTHAYTHTYIVNPRQIQKEHAVRVSPTHTHTYVCIYIYTHAHTHMYERTIDISGCGTDGGREVSGHRAD